MLQGLAEGETDPAALAARAHHTLRATPEQLCDALVACAELNPFYRQLLKMSLKELQLMEEQINQQLASLLRSVIRPSIGWRKCLAWAEILANRSCHCRSLPFGAPSGLVGRRMPRTGAERRAIHQRSFA